MNVVPGAVIDRVGNQGGPGEMNSAAGSPQRSISFNVNGVSRMQNQTKLDGASAVYVWLPTNTAYVPSAEAIEEVRIVTNSYNAQQGMAAGAAINVITKSGTNKLKGTAWIYDSDAKWKARNYFQTPTGLLDVGSLGRRGHEHAVAEEQPAGPQAVRRQPGRPDHQGQAVLLRQLGAVRPGSRTRRSGSSASRRTRSGAATSAARA